MSVHLAEEETSNAYEEDVKSYIWRNKAARSPYEDRYQERINKKLCAKLPKQRSAEAKPDQVNYGQNNDREE